MARAAATGSVPVPAPMRSTVEAGPTASSAVEATTISPAVAATTAINGGSDSDRCVQNAGSGPIRKCETADFSVTVDLPAAEDEGQTIQVDIIVTNNGPQRASYAVEIDNSNSGATCNGGLDGGIYPQAALDAGEQRQLPYDGFSCTHEGDPSSATVQATVRVNGIDPNAANNTDSDQVSIIAN